MMRFLTLSIVALLSWGLQAQNATHESAERFVLGDMPPPARGVPAERQAGVTGTKRSSDFSERAITPCGRLWS